MNTPPAPIQTQFYTGADGLKLCADVGGDPAQPTVILLHGGGQTRHSWTGAMRELLAQGYHVINLDARGHGDSQWSPTGDYGLEALSADLLAVMATLPTRPALVGASMGGGTLLYAAGNHTEPIAQALILVDIVPRVETEGVGKIIAFMRSHVDGFATLDEAAAAVAAYNPNRARPGATTGLMKNLRLREDGRLHWHWDPKFVARKVHVEPPQFADLLLAAASRVRTPTLLVRGLKSDLIGEDGIAELKAHLPALEVADIAGAGHMVVGDRNDAFNQAVLQFLHQHLPHPQA